MPNDPILSAVGLTKTFRVPQGVVKAVRHVSFDLYPRETLGLVGESGCGKSTLGRTIIRLYEPDDGKVYLDGIDITHLKRNALRPFRRKMQIIFQDPYASLNPRKTAEQIIRMPMIVHRMGTASEQKMRVKWLMHKVGLRSEMADRHPHEFSGGQKQRIGLARALALNPKILICDEPISALDVSIQAQVINLLVEIQAELGLSFLFISHDLSVVAHFASRVIVMYLGSFVEIADCRELWCNPLHPYTQALIRAVPFAGLNPEHHLLSKELLKGDLPSPLHPPDGCSFNTRCPISEPRCRKEAPVLRSIGESGHMVACHFA